MIFIALICLLIFSSTVNGEEIQKFVVIEPINIKPFPERQKDSQPKQIIRSKPSMEKIELNKEETENHHATEKKPESPIKLTKEEHAENLKAFGNTRWFKVFVEKDTFRISGLIKDIEIKHKVESYCKYHKIQCKIELVRIN